MSNYIFELFSRGQNTEQKSNNLGKLIVNFSLRKGDFVIKAKKFFKKCSV